jgi:RNA polymerase sigma-70 factor, ECF subfamily
VPAKNHAAIDRDRSATPASADDVAIVARLLRKDERDFSALVDKHHGAMLRVAQTMVRTRAVAEEVLQDTWQAVLEGLPSFDGRTSLRRWIFRVLVDHARARAAREPHAASSGASSDGHDAPELIARALRAVGKLAADAKPEAALLDGELRAILEAAVERLPASMRAVLTLRDLAAWTAPETCAVLDLTEVNQRALLHRARGRVRAALNAYLEGRS